MKLGMKVLALVHLGSEGAEVCKPGDTGTVVDVSTPPFPTVKFKRTGRASVVDPDTEVVRTSGRGASRA